MTFAILGNLKERGVFKIIYVPAGQSTEFDEGPEATRKWLVPYIGEDWHLIEFVEEKPLRKAAPYTVSNIPRGTP